MDVSAYIMRYCLADYAPSYLRERCISVAPNPGCRFLRFTLQCDLVDLPTLTSAALLCLLFLAHLSGIICLAACNLSLTITITTAKLYVVKDLLKALAQ